MSLHWGGDFLTSVLPPNFHDLLHEVEAYQHYDWSQDKGFVQCNATTAEVFLVMPGKMPRRINRKKLRHFLSEGIDIQYGKRLESITVNESSESVTASFDDGVSVEGICLVGCDGSRSRVREILLRNTELAKNKEYPYTLLNFPYTYPAEISKKVIAIHPTFKIGYHPSLPHWMMIAGKSILLTTAKCP